MIILKNNFVFFLVFLIIFSCKKRDSSIRKVSDDGQARAFNSEHSDTVKDNHEDLIISNEQKETVPVNIQLNVIENKNKNLNLNNTTFDETLTVNELKFNIDFLKFKINSKKTKDEIDQDTQFHEDDILTSLDLTTRKNKKDKNKKDKNKKDDSTISLEDKKQIKENHDRHFKKYYKDKSIVKPEPFLFTYLKNDNENDSSSITIDLPKNMYRRVNFKIFRDLSKNDIPSLFINMVNTKNNQNIIIETSKTINIELKSKKYFNTTTSPTEEKLILTADLSEIFLGVNLKKAEKSDDTIVINDEINKNILRQVIKNFKRSFRLEKVISPNSTSNEDTSEEDIIFESEEDLENTTSPNSTSNESTSEEDIILESEEDFENTTSPNSTSNEATPEEN